MASIQVGPWAGSSIANAAGGTITGKVFQDFNMNGTMNTTVAVGKAVDVGVAGIEVRAFDSTGAQVGSTTTGTGGTYTLTVSGAATTSVRIEFAIPANNPALDGLQPSYATTTGATGSATGGSVQFATIGNTGVNFAVARPGEYCQDNPTLVTCASDVGTGSTTNVGAFTFPAAMSGFTDVNANNTRIGSSNALGSVFGVGADRTRNTFYGTYVRRHIEYGQDGAVNTIYRVNLDNPGTVTSFVTLPGSLPAHDPTPAGSYPAYSGDTGVFDQVGRVGLGDVDVTDDGTTLLAVDMDETAPKLYFVPIQGSGNSVTAGAPQPIAIPKPADFGGITCPGKWHPMGIGTRGNRILVGGVCGAENTVSPTLPRGYDPTRATSFILEYSGPRDGSGSFSTIWSTSMSYERGCVYREGTRIPCDPLTSTVGSIASADWAAWNGYPNLKAVDGPTGGLFASNPQPMLSNIEITDSGDLVIGLRDRYQDQIKVGMPAYSLAYADASYPAPPIAYPRSTGTMSGGDLLRICKTASGLATETNGTCTNLAGAQTLEAGLKEFYYDPYANWADAIGPLHSETADGSTASLPGYPGVWSTEYDVTGLGRQGVLAYGACAAAAGACRGPATGYGSQNGGVDFGNLNGFNKGNALADLEIICNSAPVQIGNRLWVDSDGDGVQDPGEPPIVGATVRLYDSLGNVVSTAKTGPNGEYMFSSSITEAANGGATPDPWGGNITTGQAYTIRMDNAADYAPGGALAGYDLTSPNSTTVSVTDTEAAIDSNATLVSGYPRITVPTLQAGDVNLTYDAGFVPIVAISNYAWVDTDLDGVQDAGESGLPGVKVQLFDANGNPAVDADGNPVLEQTTDANGRYVFDNLLPGDYRAKFIPPDGYGFTVQNAASATATTDSNANTTTGLTPVFTVSGSVSGDTVTDSDATTVARFVNPTIDAGFVPAVSVGNLVWADTDRDGVQDPGEPGIAGVTLTIKNADGTDVFDVFGNPVTSTTTDANGKYVFDNLPAGQYTVTVSPPTGFVETVSGAGTTATDSSTGSATSVVLGSGVSSDMTLDFGFYVPSVSVGDFVWFDTNHDGIQDADEPPLSGVKLTIENMDGTPVTDVYGRAVTEVYTDASGYYSFDNLPLGKYVVKVTTPTGMQATLAGAGGDPAADSSTGSATSVDLNVDGQRDPTLDFGFWSPPATVGSRVWADLDMDGIQDPGEPGVAGVTLLLTDDNGSPVTDVDGNPVGPVVTDADGNYVFSNLPFGTAYKVAVTYPAGSLPTTPGQGTSTTDSSTDFVVTSQAMSVTNINDFSLDFGIVPVVSVGDFVWFDENKDGVQDPGEPGIAGVTLTISKVGGGAVTDVNGNPVTTTTTDADGRYSFDKLPAGQYVVTVTPPAGYTATQTGAGTTATDSSTGTATSRNMTISGDRDPTLDFGFYKTSVSVGDFVWFDLDEDGVQDPGEPGIQGMTLTISKAGGGPVTDVDGNPVTTTTTDANGHYSFDNLPPGQYTVTVSPPAGYAATITGAGTSATDSSSGSATSVNLTADGQRDATLDFGFVPVKVSVGDLVWFDTNGDGVQDPDEPGIAGVTLTITKADGSPVTDVFGNPVTTTTTDATGHYSFDNLPAGQYKVTVTPPAGYIPTVTGSGTSATDSSTGSATSANLTVDGQRDPTLDFGFVVPSVSVGDYVWFDTDKDGFQDPGEKGLVGVTLTIRNADGSAVTDVFGNPMTTTFTDANGRYSFDNLPPGQYVVTVAPPPGYEPTRPETGLSATDSSTGSATSAVLTTNGQRDPTLDFGFVPMKVSVGDKVWRDVNGDGRQGPIDRGVPGATLRVYDASGQPARDVYGNLVKPQVTGRDGKYLFTDLPVGSYSVRITYPRGLRPTVAERPGREINSSSFVARSLNLQRDGAVDRSLDFGVVAFYVPGVLPATR